MNELTPRQQLMRILAPLVVVLAMAGGLISLGMNYAGGGSELRTYAAIETMATTQASTTAPAKPTLPKAQPNVADPKAGTPPPAPQGMPASGPRVCGDHDSRCFNHQLINGTCAWPTSKSGIANLKKAWKINQAPGGFGPKYWNSWCKLGMAESDWSRNAIGSPTKNGRACGIPQALPCSKMRGGTKLSAEGQIAWMRNYIRERYGNPDSAWAHEHKNQWY